MDILKMSKIENPKIVLKKTLFSEACDHNALKIKNICKKSVTINFFMFFVKNQLKIFCQHIYIKNVVRNVAKVATDFCLRKM